MAINLLITGATGFVGQNLKDYLVRKSNSFGFINFDRHDIKESVKNCDQIIHLAGKAHDLKNVSSPNDYYQVNTELTKQLFDAFLTSNAKVFIMMSSVKAVADTVTGNLIEEAIPNPITHYGKSKLLAEQYLQEHVLPADKKVYILRPCMIHGPGNKGNLNLLYKIVSLGLPWPLGDFKNQRSFCSIENICFIINELIERKDIESGIYNIADDKPLSTNEVIRLIAESKKSKAKILSINRSIISFFAKIGNHLKLPLNTERLEKLTESYMVNNEKIIKAIGQPLPVSSEEGLLRTFKSFSNNG